MTTPCRVLVLDDDQDLLDLVRELFALLHVSCVAVPSFRALVDRREEALACGAAILDINLGQGQPDGLEALAWLREQGFGGRVVILTGHARRDPVVQRATRNLGVEVLQKPVDVPVLEAIARSVSSAAP